MRDGEQQRRGAGADGVTLVELLVALAIVAVMTSFLFTTFATTTRSIEIGEARQDVVQNARAALTMMAGEIQTAAIESRRGNFVFVCADGLNSLPQARIEFDPVVHTTINVRGVGNAQHPLGLDFAANGTVYGIYGQVFDLYRSPFGTVTNTIVSIKPDDVREPPGPPDRLDFVGLAANRGGFSFDTTAQFVELRYMIATDAFNDGEDNDLDGTVDGGDAALPGGGVPVPTWAGAGDVLALNNVRATNLDNVVKLGLYRGIDTTPDGNPFSALAAGPDPQGRYPARNFSDLTLTNGGERIGALIYDLQFEFYGRIATLLDANGAPVRFGIGWGYQDARGEDVGTDADPTVFDANGTQANGILDADPDGGGPLLAEPDVGTDNAVNDPDDAGGGLPDNVSDNDGNMAEPSIGENNGRLDSRVMGVWDSRSPDPRNPRLAEELNGQDDDGDSGRLQSDGVDNDGDGLADDSGAVVQGAPEPVGTAMFDSTDDAADIDGVRDDRFYEAFGRPEGVDERDEGDPTDDTLPRAVRITITARDRNRVLEPVVLRTTVWLPTAN